MIIQQEENNLPDLANSCEYLTNEKLCLAVSESEKARSCRQVRCKNTEKMTCCYLCMFVLDCATPCQFLGNNEKESQQIEPEKNLINKALIIEKKPELDKKENTQVDCCSLCNVEMSQTRTIFRIDGWEEAEQKFSNNTSTRFGEETLPAIIYLCPKCGKIELKADKRPNKN